MPGQKKVRLSKDMSSFTKDSTDTTDQDQSNMSLHSMVREEEQMPKGEVG